MTDVTHPRALAFCNETMRPLMTQAVAFYFACKNAGLEASTPEVSGAFNTDDGTPIRDAANPVEGTPNGKKPLTTGAIFKALIDASTFCSDMEAYGGDKLRRAASIASQLAPFDEANGG
jgi:hypothetical protein